MKVSAGEGAGHRGIAVRRVSILREGDWSASNMAPKATRKEPKEQVTYQPSKRKTPAFKPLRPSKIQRSESDKPANSTKAASAATAPKRPAAATSKKRPATIAADSDDESNDNLSGDDEDAVEEDVPSKRPATKKAAITSRTASVREVSPMSISSSNDDAPDDKDNDAPMPSQSDDIPSIPQALLVRLLHEGFTHPKTKMDKHAVGVLQKYIEVFVRETIARCKLDKQHAAEKGDISAQEAEWLELEDLDKAAPALMLDF